MQKAVVPALVLAVALALAAAPQASGLGYMIPPGISMVPGQSMDGKVVLILEANRPVTATVIGEAKEWVTLGEVGEIPPGATSAELPYTVTVPADVAMQGEHTAYIAAYQKGIPGTALTVNRQVYVEIPIMVNDPSLPTKAAAQGISDALEQDGGEIARLAGEAAGRAETLADRMGILEDSLARAGAENAQLRQENERLAGYVRALEERIASLQALVEEQLKVMVQVLERLHGG